MIDRAHAFSWMAILFVAALTPRAALSADEAKKQATETQTLTDRDRKLLERLLTEFVFDPKGAEFVLVPVTRHTTGEAAVADKRLGWLVPGKPEQPDRVSFADSETLLLAAGTKVEKVDFVALCRERYEKKQADSRSGHNLSSKRGPISDIERDFFNTPDLVNAAWLHRFGEDNLAAEALERAAEQTQESNKRLSAKKSGNNAEVNLVAGAKKQLAISAYLAMVSAFTARSDEEALADGQRLLKLYPEQAKTLNQAEAIYNDLLRRQKKGTLGKKPPEKLPEGFDSWDADKKFAYLIDALDETDSERGYFGNFQLRRNPREEALIQLGESIIPKLIEVIETDERLTRVLEYDRHFHVNQSIVLVRQKALSVALSILKVRNLDPTEKESFLYIYDQETAKKIVGQLRVYWKANAGIPFNERMMKVLTNPLASDNACREAAENLTALQSWYRVGPLGIKLRADDNPPPNPRPAVAKFKNPTAAEAILTVFDREMAPRDPRFNWRGGVEQDYLGPLVELHDKRIAPEFVRRYKAAKTLHLRLVWAIAAHGSGDDQPLKELAHEFETGALVIPGHDLGEKISIGETGTSDLSDLIGCLVRVELPETDRALMAVTDAKHPFHNRVAVKITATIPSGFPFHEEPYLEHPYCLAIFRQQLDDTTPTGAIYGIKGDSLDIHGPTFGDGSKLPDFLLDPATRRESARELACDRAAILINELVLGMPLVYPLRKDRDTQLKEMILLMDRYRGRFRRLTPAERHAVGWKPPFVVDFPPLGKPATADDLKQGRALFELSGTGKLASIKLPATAKLKQSPTTGKPEAVLIVQAEIDAAGNTVYGVIGRHTMRAAKAEELEGVKPLEKPPPLHEVE